MGITPDQCRAILDRAMSEEVGISVEVAPGEVHVVRNALYNERKAAGANPEWEKLSLFIPTPRDGKDEIFVVKKDTELPG